MTQSTVRMTVNGESVEREVEPCMALADFLRDSLGLTGTHLGCEHGVCGSCTILLDGAPVRSCLMLAVQADECDLTTVEGLGSAEDLHPLQLGFAQTHALQCGFCTPGLLMTAYALLQENPTPTRQEVREAIAGNLCRCTGYNGIVEGIMWAARS